MSMDNEYYRQIWIMLDGLHNVRYPGKKLKSMYVTDIITFAEDVRGQLDEFVKEVAARTKAVDNAAEESLNTRRNALKAKGFDDVEPHGAPVCPE
jgi:hypothetical protein